MERHLPPEPSIPSLSDKCHGAASASFQPLLSVFPSLALPQPVPRWKTLARKRKWRVKCSVSSSPFSFGFADMPKRVRRQVTAEDQDTDPLFASTLVSHVSENKLLELAGNYSVSP